MQRHLLQRPGVRLRGTYAVIDRPGRVLPAGLSRIPTWERGQPREVLQKLLEGSECHRFHSELPVQTDADPHVQEKASNHFERH